MTVDLLLGDCIDALSRGGPPFDAIITDPPGGGRFMALAFDSDRGGRDRWIAWLAERLAAGRARTKEGGYLICWAFGRTSGWTHRAIEDAGWSHLGPIMHMHGEGYPKAGKKALKPMHETWFLARNGRPVDLNIDACRVRRNWAERGEAWLRSGNSAKPGAEKIGGAPPGNGINANPEGSFAPDVLLSHCEGCECVGVKAVRGSHPMSKDGTVRTVGYQGGAAGRNCKDTQYTADDGTETIEAWECVAGCDCGWSTTHPAGGDPPICERCGLDMWWACAVAQVDQQSGERKSGIMRAGTTRANLCGYAGAMPAKTGKDTFADSGGASRYYPQFHPRAHYFSKPSGSERDAGCEHLLWRKDDDAPIGWRRVTRAEWERLPTYAQAQAMRPKGKVWRSSGCVHATVKGIEMMRWMVRLLTQPEETIGDLFGGSCTTGIAAALEGRNAWSCDFAEEAIEIGYNRLRHWSPAQVDLLAPRDTAIRLHGWKPPAYDYWIPPDEPSERENKPRARPADPRQVDLFGDRRSNGA
jgi:site-specific DNA-methyltransferase (adenine-specific)